MSLWWRFKIRQSFGNTVLQWTTIGGTMRKEEMASTCERLLLGLQKIEEKLRPILVGMCGRFAVLLVG